MNGFVVDAVTLRAYEKRIAKLADVRALRTARASTVHSIELASAKAAYDADAKRAMEELQSAKAGPPTVFDADTCETSVALDVSSGETESFVGSPGPVTWSSEDENPVTPSHPPPKQKRRHTKSRKIVHSDEEREG